VKIYEPYGDVADKIGDGYTMFNTAINLYRSRNFKEAIELFTQSNSAMGNDIPSSLYIDRCRELIQHPPSEDWDGVYTAKTK
jgi:adenylate cyclase